MKRAKYQRNIIKYAAQLLFFKINLSLDHAKARLFVMKAVLSTSNLCIIIMKITQQKTPAVKQKA